jgi:hypothetical protein
MFHSTRHALTCIMDDQDRTNLQLQQEILKAACP